jgi:hypothetical protein
MRIARAVFLAMIALAAGCAEVQTTSRGGGDMREQMKRSLVYLEISSYSYDQFRPWKNTEVQQKSGIGVAVGDYEVITPAWNLTDATLINVRRFGRNEFIPATIKVIDYEIDLALLRLDPNTAGGPLKPLRFVEQFRRGAKLDYYWLSENGILNTGHGYLDRAEVHQSTVSFARLLNYIVNNTSGEAGNGQVYFDGAKPIAVACWSEGTKEAGLIPAPVINRFIADVASGDYKGVPCIGFGVSELLDPAMRGYLKIPAEIKDGVLVTDVYNVGTGSDALKAGDCILAIDGKQLDSYGRFLHPMYDRISFDHLITAHKVGETINFDIWRDGSQQQIKVEAKGFAAGQMLIPYYDYGRQPEYLVTGGFVFQKVTRSYLANWGKEWAGKVAPHLYHYFRDLAFKPTAERKEVVMLSFVLPAEINLGYKDLGQLVVKKFNGVEVGAIADIVAAQRLNPDSKYDVVEFELDNPTVVIPRASLPIADKQIAQTYGIRKMVNVE